MQRALALDGVEWSAGDMTFDQTGRINRAKSMVQLVAGTGGVFTGGVVANPSGFNITITGPLQFQANGELVTITAPANVTAAPSTTNFIIAVYQETQDTPATYYGGGSPPNIHANETPTVICRGTGAVLANGEVPLATVVANEATSTSITDTRVLLPFCDNSGNVQLGALKTIDGMDPSVHQALVATPAVLGHVKLGGFGGACPTGTLGGAWLREAFWDVASTFGSTKLLDDADFSGPPASSNPFATTGEAFKTQYLPTRNGDLMDAGYGPRIAARYTLTFTATAIVAVALGLNHWDDTLRVKANGVTLFSSTTPNGGSGQVVNFNTVIGTNTIVLYLCNGGGNQYHVGLTNSLFTDSRFTFSG